MLLNKQVPSCKIFEYFALTPPPPVQSLNLIDDIHAEQKPFASGEPYFYYQCIGVFILPETETNTDTETDKLAQNPMGIYVGVCLCAV